MVALILSIGEGSNEAAIGIAAATLITRVHLTIWAAFGIPHIEILSSFLFFQDKMCEGIKTSWGGIRHTIGLQNVVIDFPFRLIFFVCLGYIKEVGSDVNNQHSFLVNLIDSETGILTLICCRRGKNRVESDWL